jgi:hypothetical protein
MGSYDVPRGNIIERLHRMLHQNLFNGCKFHVLMTS